MNGLVRGEDMVAWSVALSEVADSAPFTRRNEIQRLTCLAPQRPGKCWKGRVRRWSTHPPMQMQQISDAFERPREMANLPRRRANQLPLGPGARTAPGLGTPVSPTVSYFKRLEHIPSSSERDTLGWTEWFEKVTAAFRLQGYDALSAARHIRVLAKFAVTSPEHREAVMAYLETSAFLTLWRERMNVLMGAMNEAQLTDALYNMAYLEIRSDRLFGSHFFEQWFIHVSNLSDLTAPALARMVWALGILRVCPDTIFLQNVALAFNREFGDFRSYHLADMMWALGRCEAQLPDELVELWFSAFEKECKNFSANDLAVSLWGLALVNVRPDRLVSQYWMENATRLFDEMTPLDLCNIMFALGKLEWNPGTQFLKLWLSRWMRMTVDADVQGFVDSFWGLTKLGIKPNAAFLDEFYDGWRRERTFIRTPQVRNSLYAFARCGILPERDYFEHWYEAFKSNLSDYDYAAMPLYQVERLRGNGPTLAIIIWSFAKLDLTPSSKFMLKWYKMAEFFVPYMGAQDLTNCAWAFARLSLAPLPRFSNDLLKQFYLSRKEFRADNLVLFLSALVGMGISLPDVFLLQWSRRFRKLVNDASPHHLTETIKSFAYLELKPSLVLYEEWKHLLSAWSLHFISSLDSFSFQQLVTCLWSFATLRLSPPTPVLDGLLSALHGKGLDGADSVTLANLAWSFEQLRIRPPRDLWRSWNRAWKREVDFASETVSARAERSREKIELMAT